MSRRDEPAPAGEDRGRARTGRRRRRSWRGRKPPPASNGSAGEDSVAAELVNPPAEVTKPAGSGGKRRKSAVPARLRRVEEVSAGGLVVDDRDGLVVGALIAKHDRRGRLVWSLPKGHVENGETFEQTAAREVAEETGVTGEVVGALGKVDYWFVFGGRKIHKTVHHFLLRRVGGELSDRDVEVVEVAWFPLKEIAGQLAYPDERRLIGQVHELLAKSA